MHSLPIEAKHWRRVLAQVVERLLRMREVLGSMPVFSFFFIIGNFAENDAILTFRSDIRNNWLVGTYNHKSNFSRSSLLFNPFE